MHVKIEITGPQGCGKSTVARIVTNELKHAIRENRLVAPIDVEIVESISSREATRNEIRLCTRRSPRSVIVDERETFETASPEPAAVNVRLTGVHVFEDE